MLESGESIAPARVAVALAAVAALWLAGCETPSSRVDGADLEGVFDPRRSASAAASSAPGASASTRPMPSAGATSSARPSPSVSPPQVPRVVGGDGCVEASGTPRTDLARTLGRPACRGSEVLEWRDPAGSPRYACLFVAPGSHGPLPLVVFLPGDSPTLDAPTAVHKQTGLRVLQGKPSLGPPGSETTFHVLAVQGRLFSGQATASFDAAYGGEDNVDVRTIEHFVDRVTERKLVDPRRVYALGLGPGGTMAATWAMISADRVAAFASFAAPPPTVRWICPGPPPPATILYRACDAVVACDGVEGWIREREGARAETSALRLGDDAREALLCEPKNRCGEKRGTASHARWPKALEKRILTFLGGHSMSGAQRD